MHKVDSIPIWAAFFLNARGAKDGIDVDPCTP